MTTAKTDKKTCLNACKYWHQEYSKQPENDVFRKLYLMAREQYKAFHEQTFSKAIQIVLPL